MTKINKGNDFHVREQISDALTALETRASTLEAGAWVYAYKAADQTGIGTSFADVTSTGLAVAASSAYEFEFHLIADADAASTGIDVACNGPSAPTAIYYTQTYWGAAGPTMTTAFATAYDSNTAAPFSAGTNKAIYTVCGILLNGANAGTLIARIKREAVGSGPNVRAGSFGRLRKLA